MRLVQCITECANRSEADPRLPPVPPFGVVSVIMHVLADDMSAHHALVHGKMMSMLIDPRGRRRSQASLMSARVRLTLWYCQFSIESTVE